MQEPTPPRPPRGFKALVIAIPFLFLGVAIGSGLIGASCMTRGVKARLSQLEQLADKLAPAMTTGAPGLGAGLMVNGKPVLAATGTVQPTRLYAAQLLGAPMATCPANTSCLIDDSGDSHKIKLQGTDGTIEEIWPGLAKRLPPSALSMLGPEIRIEAGINGGGCIMQIDPSNGKTPPFSCHFADVFNGGIGPDDSDAQFGCGWNQSQCPGYNPTKGGWGFNAENYCGQATGCADGVHAKQIEAYFTSDPPPATGSPWQALHAYAQGDQIVGRDGVNYIATAGGTTGNVCVGPQCNNLAFPQCTGGPCNLADPEVPQLKDGTVIWAHYGGHRLFTLNQTVSDFGFNEVAIDADSVKLGNGHNINTNVLEVNNGGLSITSVDDGIGGSNILQIPANLNGLVGPIKFVVPGTAAGILEICPSTGCTDGCEGICLRGDLTSIAGVRTLNIGSASNPMRSLYGGQVAIHSPSDPPFEYGAMTVLETDNTRPDELKGFMNATVNGNGGFGAGIVFFPHADVFMEDSCTNGLGGAGTYVCGHEICSRFHSAVNGHAMGFRVHVIATNYSDDITTAASFIGDQNAVDAVNLNSTPFARSRAVGAGSNWTLTVAAGTHTGCVIPSFVISENKIYDFKWKAEGEAMTF